MNIVGLTGRLSFEPELQATANGNSVVHFQVASDRSYQAAGQERKADFIDCVAFGKTAEFISRFFHKGSMIAIEGTIRTQNYTDKSGKQRKSVEVVVNNASFCGSKAEQNGAAAPPPPINGEFEELIDDEGDLPF